MGTNQPALQEKPRIEISEFQESLLIVKTGKDSRGNSYNDIGTLNQAAWIGENSQVLLDEIQRMEFALQRIVNLLENASPLDALLVARKALGL